jgi:hypothetical protein
MIKDGWNGIQMTSNRLGHGRHPAEFHGRFSITRIQDIGTFNLVMILPSIHVDHLFQVIGNGDHENISRILDGHFVGSLDAMLNAGALSVDVVDSEKDWLIVLLQGRAKPWL